MQRKEMYDKKKIAQNDRSCTAVFVYGTLLSYRMPIFVYGAILCSSHTSSYRMPIFVYGAIL